MASFAQGGFDRGLSSATLRRCAERTEHQFGGSDFTHPNLPNIDALRAPDLARVHYRLRRWAHSTTIVVDHGKEGWPRQPAWCAMPPVPLFRPHHLERHFLHTC